MSTIREVAKHAGVSIGTVSKVLNGSDDRVDAASKERILASIRTLRYKPPPFEANQRSAISNNLALIVPDLTEHPLFRHEYFLFLLDGILEYSAFRGWSVTIFAETMWDNVGNAVRKKYDGRCDALIVIAPQPNRDIVSGVHKRGVPIVQIGTTAWLEDVSSVDIDNQEVGRIVASHFLQLGHRRLGFVTLEREQVSSCERFIGFQEIAGDCATKFSVGRGESVEEFGRRFAALGSDRPTALMGWHDGLAIGLVHAVKANGLDVPKNISIAGVDDSSDSREAGIELTTVTNPLYEIGKKAAEVAINRVFDHSLPREVVKIQPKLIQRATTGPCFE